MLQKELSNHRVGKWRIQSEAAGAYSLLYAEGIVLGECLPSVELSDASLLPEPSQWEVILDEGPPFAIEYVLADRVVLTLRFQTVGEEDWVAVSLRITNASSESFAVRSVSPLQTSRVKADVRLDRSLRHGVDLVGLASMNALGGSYSSHACAALADSAGTRALVLGFRELDKALCNVDVVTTADDIETLRAVSLRESIPLPPRQSLEIPSLLVGAGNSLSEAMREYAGLVAEAMGSRTGPVKTGWCSWYYYYGTDAEEDVLRNLETLAASPFKDMVTVVQIDDGWNLPTPRHARVWGDWYPGAKFPHGMRHVAEQIRKAGFVPGLWLAPFSVAPDSQLAKEHPDWLVQSGADGPATYEGIHALDLSHPKALDFVRTTFECVFDDWAYEYVKLDFLMHGIQEGVRHDPTLTTAQVFRQGLGVIRAVAGDRFILNCGAPMGPSIGLCDGMRIGFDVSSRWSMPFGMDDGVVGNCNIRAAAIQTVWRQWMHQVWWRNDPDCLIVRAYGSEPEKQLFSSIFGQAFLDGLPFGLEYEEAAFWVRLVWITGTMAVIGENLAELSPDRCELLKQAFPPNSWPARWVDWYKNLNVNLLKTESGPVVVGVFNIGDETEGVAVPRSKLAIGPAWTFRERLTGETFSGSGDCVALPPLPPHAGRLWELI